MIVLSDSMADTVLQALASRLVGSVLQLYGGVVPDPAGSETLEPLLVAVPLQVVIENRGVTLGVASEVLAQDQGLVSWGRVVDAGDVWLMDLAVGDETADVQIDNAQVYPGASISLSQLRIVGV